MQRLWCNAGPLVSEPTSHVCIRRIMNQQRFWWLKQNTQKRENNEIRNITLLLKCKNLQLFFVLYDQIEHLWVWGSASDKTKHLKTSSLTPRNFDGNLFFIFWPRNTWTDWWAMNMSWQWSLVLLCLLREVDPSSVEHITRTGHINTHMLWITTHCFTSVRLKHHHRTYIYIYI